MLETLRLFGAAAVAAALLYVASGWDPAAAQAPRQIKLTEKQVESFIAAQKKMAVAKADSELGSIAKEHGFVSIEEHDEVEANILLVMDGIDPQSMTFTEPPVQIARLIEEVKADKALPEADRKQALEELGEALKDAQPIQFPSNIELVKKYFDKIKAALE